MPREPNRSGPTFNGDIALSEGGKQTASGYGHVTVTTGQQVLDCALDWTIDGGLFRKERNGHLTVGWIRGLGRTDDQTLLIRFDTALGVPGQLAVRCDNSRALASEITSAQQAADEASEREARAFADLNRAYAQALLERSGLASDSSSLQPAEVRAAIDLMGEIDTAQEGPHDECALAMDWQMRSTIEADFECQDEWPHYYFPDLEGPRGPVTFCARCVRQIVQDSEMPDGIVRST